MPKSTSARPAGKVTKPGPDFPLFPHATGRWAKKVRGKFAYFGKTADDPTGQAALELWLEQKDDLLAGRVPRSQNDGLTLCDLVNRFLTVKEHHRDTGEIAGTTFSDYYNTCERLLAAVGKNRRVDDLMPEDFEALRAKIARKRGPVGIGNEITKIRVLFNYAYESGLLDKPVRYGPTFKRPSKKVLRKERAKKGQRLFEPKQIHALTDAAGVQMKAMILLALNCGFGNADIGRLPLSAINLGRGWVDFPRPKTGVERRCKLWPETVKAIREAIKERPAPKTEESDGLLFVTKYGQSWSKGTHDNPISKEFRKLTDKTKVHRPGLTFYALRHTFETVAGESLDQVAVDHIMGHIRDDMASVYREKISDKRLSSVSAHVRKWLFKKVKAK